MSTLLSSPVLYVINFFDIITCRPNIIPLKTSLLRFLFRFFSHFPLSSLYQFCVMGLRLTKFSIVKKTLALPLQNPAVSSLDKFSSSGVVVMTDSEGFLHQQEASTASSNFSCPQGFRQCLSHPFTCYSVSFLLLAPLLVSPTLHVPGGESVRRLA